MGTEDYKTTLTHLARQRRQLRDRRAELEAQLSELNNEISHLTEIVSRLSLLAGNTSEEGSVVGLGITDAIRAVLRESEELRLAPSDINNLLHEKGFDFSGYTQPMASIYKVLTRLKENDEVELEKEDHNIYYRWKEKDEDIPF